MGRTTRKRPARVAGGKQCVLCRSGGELTSDHIPPKNLFPSPRPSNLITVPSCKRCNDQFSKDDEYFRLMHIMRSDVGSHAAYNELWPTVYRSLERRRGHGFTNALLESTGFVEIESPAGLILGNLPTYNGDLVLLDRVVSRVAVGLFYHEFGRRLPADYCAVSYSRSGMAGNIPGIKHVEAMCAKITASAPKTIGADVFSYWFQRTTDNPNASVWLLLFFNRVPFFCMTLPKSVGEKRTYASTDSPYIEM
jgi:hypothetical protein